MWEWSPKEIRTMQTRESEENTDSHQGALKMDEVNVPKGQRAQVDCFNIKTK